MLSRIYKSHLRALIRLSIPIISGQIGWVLMGFADNVMVGKVGYVSLAAAGITNSVFFLVTIFSMGVLMVVPTIVAEMLHPGKRHTLRSLQQETQWLSQILALLTFGILMLVYANFDLLNQEKMVEEEAKPYFLVIAISTFPNLWFMAGKNLCDGYQKTSPSMVITFVALLLNILLNWMFIFGHGVSPMGLLGAGYATLISRLFMAVAITWYMNKNLSIPGNQYESQSILPFGKWLHLKHILSLGVPSGFQYFFEVAAFALAGIMAGWLGAKELAAHQIGITLSSLTYMFALGISTASSIIIGNAFARKNLLKTESAGKTALGLITAIMICFSLLFGIFRFFLAEMFSEEVQVIAFTSGILLIAALYQIFDGLQGVALGVLRGMRDVKVPLIFTLIAYWGISIPLGYWLAFEQNMGIHGIWYGLTAGLFCSAMFLSLRFRRLIVNSRT